MIKKLNQYVMAENIKLKGIHMLNNPLEVGDWMAKIDLKDAYS